MSNIFRDFESLGKSNGKKWSNIWTFLFRSGLKSPRKKKVFLLLILPWSTLLWHRCYYPHRSRNALSPVCRIFLKRLAPWTTKMCFKRLCFFKEVFATSVTLFWQTGKSGKWQVIWCLSKPLVIHDVGSLCISTMWRRPVAKETKGNLTNMTSSTIRLSFTIPYLLFPSICYSSSSSSLSPPNLPPVPSL